MKGSKILMLTFIMLIIVFFIGYINIKEKNSYVSIDVNIVDMQSNINELKENCDTIVIAKAKRAYSYKLQDMIFTNYIFHINRVVKEDKNTNLPEDIEVRYTGGTIGNDSASFILGVKTPDINGNYLLLLKKVFPNDKNNNYYGVLGSEKQGIFKIQIDDMSNRIVKVEKFNTANEIEKDIQNKDMEKIISSN